MQRTLDKYNIISINKEPKSKRQANSSKQCNGKNNCIENKNNNNKKNNRQNSKIISNKINYYQEITVEMIRTTPYFMDKEEFIKLSLKKEGKIGQIKKFAGMEN